jgi:hypothetical protein
MADNKIHTADSPDFQISDEKRVHGDIALDFMQNAASGEEAVVIDKATTARVLRKIDLILLPIMAYVFLLFPYTNHTDMNSDSITEMLQFLDKSTLSYAAIFGLQKDTGLVGTDYSWLTSIFYLGKCGVTRTFLRSVLFLAIDTSIHWY